MINLIIFLIFILFIIYIQKKIEKETKKNSYKKYKKKQHKTTQTKQKKEKKMNTTNIAKHFNISARELNKIFEELQWIYKKDRWWLTTKLGKEKGAKEYYDVKTKTKYIKWEPSIKNNTELINKIYNKKPKQNENIGYGNFQQKTKITNTEKKEKGNEYEKYIADFFRKQNYYVWEHGKEKGVKDSSIDLIVKKDKYIYFVQCKNWEKWKINHKEVKATRMDVREYLKKEKNLWNLIKDYQSKILYVTPKECLSKSAYTYIKENSNIVEYQVIPINK